MATIPAPVSEPQAAISPIGRITGVFFSPKATFEDIVRKPNWILPSALVLLLSLAAVIVLNSHFNWRDYISQQIEKSPRAAQLSAEAKERQVEVSKFCDGSNRRVLVVDIHKVEQIYGVTLTKSEQ